VPLKFPPLNPASRPNNRHSQAHSADQASLSQTTGQPSPSQTTQEKYFIVPFDAPDALNNLLSTLRDCLPSIPEDAPVNILAIGSDRTTGDCLGPLVGDYLSEKRRFRVFGTLDNPVHATNLVDIVPEIQGFTIAVDAALGSPIGGIAIRKGGLAPGAAFGRQLPSVGNISVSGLVCKNGPLSFERLRSVRLGFVRHLAHLISTAISLSVESHTVQTDRLNLQIPAPKTPLILDITDTEQADQKDIALDIRHSRQTNRANFIHAGEHPA